MTRPLIAVTDSVFPSLEPAMAALKRLDPEIRIAKSASEGDILDVARDADGVLVTYAKLSGALLRQLNRCKVIGRFGLGVDNIDIQTAAALQYNCHVCAGLLPAGGFRSHNGSCASAGAKGRAFRLDGTGSTVGNAGGRSDPQT